MSRSVIVALAALVMWSGARAQTASEGFVPYYKYRVYLRDKKRVESQIKHPERYLSERSIERRRRQRLPIDATDVPVTAKYLKRISETGVEVILKSKWNNTVVVQCRDIAVMEAVRDLPFVTGAVQVARYAAKADTTVWERQVKRAEVAAREQYEEPDNPRDSLYYGAGDYQISFIGGKGLHEAGYRGDGMSVAVIDGGFLNADVVGVMKNTEIAGTCSVRDPDVSVYVEGEHGLQVFSCMGANEPHVMVGTAPEATYWLLSSEDGDSEQEVEEDNWAAALEFADSVGVDLVNSSVGYGKYDSPRGEVMYYERNGRTQLISRTASMAADKGMIVCCAAGNSGEAAMTTIAVPADAPNVITVGSIADIVGVGVDVLFFSSRGGSYDGRIKPDVLCCGIKVACSNGRVAGAYGTSISSPVLCGMIACLWQALPDLTAYEIMDIVRRSGDRALSPDNTYGYGVPDFAKAWEMGRALAAATGGE